MKYQNFNTKQTIFDVVIRVIQTINLSIGHPYKDAAPTVTLS